MTSVSRPPYRSPGVSLPHLGWIPTGAGVGFLASFVFGDAIAIPVDLYYLIYFAIVLGFLAFYARWTGLDLRARLRRRLVPGVLLGVVGGVVLSRGVLARPETLRLEGTALAWAIVWRGVVYGTVDGLLLFVFPWIVVWRSFAAEEGDWSFKVGAVIVAMAAILLVTTTYHLGYGDFRSRKILQPNVGSAIGSLPTLVSANPVASPVAHVFLHVTAVIHSPGTDLFLPPHRE